MNGVRPLDRQLADLAGWHVFLGAGLEESDLVELANRLADRLLARLQRIGLAREHDQALGHAEDVQAGHAERVARVFGAVDRPYAAHAVKLDSRRVDRRLELEHCLLDAGGEPGRLAFAQHMNQGFGRDLRRDGEGGADQQDRAPGARHIRVVDHRQRHVHDIVAPVVHVARDRAHVVRVLVVEARDQLRHAGGAAGELEHRCLERIARHVLQAPSRLRRVLVLHQVFQPRHAVARGTTRRKHDVHARNARLELARKTDQVEFLVALHEVPARLCVPRQVADLVLAMRRERAYGNQAGLEAADECDQELG